MATLIKQLKEFKILQQIFKNKTKQKTKTVFSTTILYHSLYINRIETRFVRVNSSFTYVTITQYLRYTVI